MQVVIAAADSTNAGKHGKEMAEQNAQMLIFLPFNWSYVDDHVGEERLNFVQKIQHLGIKISEKIGNKLFMFLFITNPTVSSLNALMFSGISHSGNSQSL